MFKKGLTNLKPMQHKKNKNIPIKTPTREKKNEKKKNIYVAVRLELDILRSQNQSLSPRPICPCNQ